jgi:hypothetical protein
MIIVLCVATIVMSGGQALGRTAPQAPRQSLFQRMHHVPDIRNGYDDYLAAADLIQDDAFHTYLNWSPENYSRLIDQFNLAATDQKRAMEAQLAEEKRLHGLGYLGVQREFVGRYAEAIDKVMMGNQKETWDPRKDLDINTSYPELLHFKSLARLLVAAAYVSFADGRASKGGQYLQEGVVFSRKMAANSVIGNLVGWAMRSITLIGYEKHSDRISLQDWQEVARFCGDSLAGTNNMPNVVAYEKKWIDKEVLTGNSLAGLLEASGFPLAAKTLQALPQGDKVRLGADVRLNMDRYYDAAIQRFQKPESEWYGSQERARGQISDLGNPTYDQLLQLLIEAHTMDTDSVAGAGGKMRTQLRLLRLHALVHMYWWNTGRLPGRLTDAAAPDEIQDPFSGKLFKYTVVADNRYRLYSEGRPEFGQVDLVYHRQPGTGKPTAAPPP